MSKYAVLLLLPALVTCASPPPSSEDTPHQEAATPTPAPEPVEEAVLTITGTALADGEAIPAAYRSGPIFGCDGEDVSPPLNWRGIPAGTQSLALIMADVFPKGLFVHWAIYNIPATSTGVAEGVPHEATLADGSRQGSLGEGNIGYFGPCPPPGETHTYLFRLYALDTVLDFLAARTDNQSVLAALEEASREGRVLAQAELTGTYTGQ